MAVRDSVADATLAPLWGELRYGNELARMLVGHAMRRSRATTPDPVLLVPGFMAGDSSLLLLRGWLTRRGHPVSMSGIRLNVGCAERIVSRLEVQLEELTDEHGPATLIGQSRGGVLARALAVRGGERVARLVMLGSPVRDPLAVSPRVLRTVRWMARLGDLGLPGLFSSTCADGDCCEAFWEQLTAPLAPHIEALAVYSRSDAIVDWQACIDPFAEPVEVDSSHCGMSVHPDVFETLERAFAGAEETRAA